MKKISLILGILALSIIITGLFYGENAITGMAVAEKEIGMSFNSSTEVLITLNETPIQITLTGENNGEVRIDVNNEEFYYSNETKQFNTAKNITAENGNLTIKITLNGTIRLDKIEYTHETNSGIPYWNSSTTQFEIIQGVTLEIDLNEYFTDNDNLTYLASGASNITIEITGSILRITPDAYFFGDRTIKAIAADQTNIVEQELRIIVVQNETMNITPEINISENMTTETNLTQNATTNITIEANITAMNFTEGEKIIIENKTLGKKTEDEALYEVYFTNITQTNETFYLEFYHDFNIPLPVFIKGNVSYNLSNTTAQPNETITLTVQLTEGILPSFSLHVGITSEVFEFGKKIPKIKKKKGEHRLIDRDDEKIDVEITNNNSLIMIYGVNATEIQTTLDAVEERIIRTEVFAANLSEMDNATITLRKTGRVTSIVKCSEIDFETLTCNSGWEKTSIPFIDDRENITFSVTSFSGYAGADITVINVQSYPTVGGNWTVLFNTTGIANLTIRASNGTTWTNETGCYDDATEVYSEQGWKLFNELNDEKILALNTTTGMPEWQKPTAKQEYDYSGEMYKITTEKGELLVSPEHRIYAREKNDYQLIKASSAYEKTRNQARLLFLDSSGQETKVIKIAKEDYSGKIYDVDVPNDVILVRKSNERTYSSPEIEETYYALEESKEIPSEIGTEEWSIEAIEKTDEEEKYQYDAKQPKIIICYCQERIETNSAVVNTKTSDCLLKCASLDQIGIKSRNASAKYAASLESGRMNDAFSRKDVYSAESTKTTLSFNDAITLSKLAPDLAANTSLCLYNSASAKSGANSFSLCLNTTLFATEEDMASANKTLASAINLIYNSPSFFNLSSMPALTLRPISTHQSSNSLSCSSLFNISSFQDNSSVFSTIASRTKPDQFISENLSILCFTSSGTDKVMLTILNLHNYVMFKNPRFLAQQKPTISVEKHKYVQVFKGFVQNEKKDAARYAPEKNKEIQQETSAQEWSMEAIEKKDEEKNQVMRLPENENGSLNLIKLSCPRINHIETFKYINPLKTKEKFESEIKNRDYSKFSKEKIMGSRNLANEPKNRLAPKADNTETPEYINIPKIENKNGFFNPVKTSLPRVNDIETFKYIKLSVQNQSRAAVAQSGGAPASKAVPLAKGVWVQSLARDENPVSGAQNKLTNSAPEEREETISELSAEEWSLEAIEKGYDTESGKEIENNLKNTEKTTPECTRHVAQWKEPLFDSRSDAGSRSTRKSRRAYTNPIDDKKERNQARSLKKASVRLTEISNEFEISRDTDASHTLLTNKDNKYKKVSVTNTKSKANEKKDAETNTEETGQNTATKYGRETLVPEGGIWSGNSNSKDLQFLSLKCGETVLNYTFVNDSVFIPDYNCSTNSFEASKVLTSGVHTIEFKFGDDIAYAFNDAATAQAAANLTQGLVGHWDCDNTFKDSSGQGNHGTQSGGVTILRGVKGRACGFDGVNDYISITNTQILNSSTFSISLWAFPTGGTSAQFMQDKLDYVNSEGSRLYRSGTTAYWAVGNGTGQIADTATITANTWNHIVGTFNGTSVCLSINGVMCSSPTIFTGNYIFDAIKMTLGSNDGGSQNFNGTIDEVRIYNRSLSATEVSALYNTTKSYKIALKTTPTKGINDETGLVGYWKMNREDGSNSTKAIDSSVYGNNGTVTGATFTNDGRFKEAYKFDGSNDYITITNSNIYNFGTDINFTLSAWVKPVIGEVDGFVLHKRNSSGTSLWNLYVGIAGAVRFEIRDVDSNLISTYPGTRAVNDNNWHHLVMIVNRGNDIGQIWVDGIQEGSDINISSVTGSLDSNNAIRIGTVSHTSPSVNLFNGSIDEVRIYNRALSASEVAALYNGTKSNKISIKTTPELGGLNDTPAPTATDETGLVGWWKMDDLTNGNTTDSSGQGNNGSVIGATFNTGRWNNGYKFDGVNDYIDAGNNSVLNINNNMTISAWIKGNSFGTGHFNTIVSKGDGDVAYQYRFSVIQSGPLNIVGTGGSNINSNTNMSTYSGKWAHVAMTHNGTISLYINGVLDKNVTGTLGSLSGYTLRIGDEAYNGLTQIFNGSIDEVRIYNRSLSADEVKELYLSKGLVGYWKMDADQKNSTDTYDSSGYYNHGLISGATFINEGRFKEGYKFDGVNDYINMTDRDSLDMGTNDFSIFSWIKYSKSSRFYHTIVNKFKSNTGYLFMTYNLTGVLYYDLGDGTAVDEYGTTNVLDGKWHFVGVVFDRDVNGTFYVDGVPDGSFTISARAGSVTNAEPFTIGKYTTLYDPSGSIDEVRIYNRALTSTEVAGLYNGTKSNKISLKDIPA